MRKITLYLFFSFLLNNNALSWEWGSFFDSIINNDEHEFCGDLARSKTSDKFKQSDIYFACREELEFQQQLEK